MAMAACGAAGTGFEPADGSDPVYVGDPAAGPRAATDVRDRDGTVRGRLVLHDLPERAGDALSEAAARHLETVAAALGDLDSVDRLAAQERELSSAVDMTRQAGRRREEREARVRRHVGGILRDNVSALRAALDEAAGPEQESDSAGGWRAAARRVVGLERATAWAEEIERVLDDVAVAREGLDEPLAAAHRLEDLVDGALDRMAHLGQRLGATDGPRVVSVRDALLAVDGEAVERALQHLLTAALMGAPEADRAEHVEIDTRTEGDMCVVAVEDDGAAHRADEMRDRLARGLGGTDGDDAGLSIRVVDAVARAHGGRCWVERSEMGGARVCMSLPAAAGELSGFRDQARPDAVPDPADRRIRHPSEISDLPQPRISGSDSVADPDDGAGDDEVDTDERERPDNVRGLFEQR